MAHSAKLQEDNPPQSAEWWRDYALRLEVDIASADSNLRDCGESGQNQEIYLNHRLDELREVIDATGLRMVTPRPPHGFANEIGFDLRYALQLCFTDEGCDYYDEVETDINNFVCQRLNLRHRYDKQDPNVMGNLITDLSSLHPYLSAVHFEGNWAFETFIRRSLRANKVPRGKRSSAPYSHNAEAGPSKRARIQKDEGASSEA
ncbi:hypothetical protein BDN72DRAFT_906258 [Pluteus cervinus]|uniref:Uncharacterized protein n=1 Tax=Pluteus cervinus TaxID=181527 RepID=A0ACD2ZZX0_9AGAR|nr:hypothetical protein BDN72DRAFT_906258 [Pluteus cervinus]